MLRYRGFELERIHRKRQGGLASLPVEIGRLLDRAVNLVRILRKEAGS